MALDDEDIEWLLSLVESEQLDEIEVHVGEDEVLVRRVGGMETTVAARVDGRVADQASKHSDEPLPDNVRRIDAPMSGVFYRSASPESDPYVSEGQQIKEGDTIGLIEVMKLFNDVHSPVSGVVRRIEVSDEARVEAGETLMLVET